MGIKSIDFQISVPKTAEISKTSSDELNRLQALQQQQNTNTQNKVYDSVSLVNSRAKAEEALIKEKQQDTGKDFKQKKGSSKRNKNKNNNKDLIEQKIGTIDIKI